MKISDKLTDKEVTMILDALENQYQHYNNLAFSTLEKGNLTGNLLHTSEASAFGRSKWIVEDWLNLESEGE